MFTGIVSDLGEILEVQEKAEGLRRLDVACNYDPDGIDIGASIACSGHLPDGCGPWEDR